MSMRRKILTLFNISEFFLLFLVIMLYYLTLPINTTNVIFIPKGNTKNIITYLNKAGYELGIIDKVYLKFLGYPQNGWIDIKSNYLTKADFLYKITTSKAALKTITLIPGETAYIFLNQLSKKLNLSRKELQKVYDKYAYKKDGNILPDTYFLPYGMKEYHLLFYLFSNTNKQYEKISNKIFGIYDKKRWYYYITLASIIQKEAANKDEMVIISSVIHNRLKKGMKLQMDGTLNYGKYSHVKVTAKRIREDKSSYNTYKNKGLPKNPICSVTLDAITAAIFPAKTDYLYFVRNNETGYHIFSSDYKSHINNIKKNRKVKKNKIKKKVVVLPQTKKVKEKNSVKLLWENVK